MNVTKIYGFLALAVLHSLIALAIFIFEGPITIPSYIALAVITSVLPQSIMKHAFFLYWKIIPIPQRIVVIVLPGLIATSAGELNTVLIAMLFGSFWFYSFYALRNEVKLNV